MMALSERGDELARIAAAIAGARRGEGQLVIVEGPAGAGKSALVAETTARADGGGFHVLRARGGELEQQFAFGVAGQLFEPLLAAAPPAVRARLLDGAAAPVEWILPARPSAAARAAGGVAVLSALYRLTTDLAAQRPLLVVVDDGHWADEPSLRWLDFLARRLGRLPVMLLVALRPGESAADAAIADGLRDYPGAVVLAPRPLTPAGVAAVVREERPTADEELTEAYHASTAGNPLYLRELLRLGPIAADEVRIASISGVGDRVARRIARVAPEAPVLATAMAVLGDRAPLARVAALAQVSHERASMVARVLRRIQILCGEDPVEFVHPVVRRSVYDAMTTTERADAHRAAAGLLHAEGGPAEATAAHLSLVPPAGSADAAARLVEAAHEALARAAPGLAALWLQRALDEHAPEPDRATLLYELGRAQMAIRDPTAADTLRAARALATDPALLVPVSTTLAELLATAGQWAEAVDLLRETEETVGDVGELVLELDAMRTILRSNDPGLVADFDRERPYLTRVAAGDSWPARAIAARLAAVAAIRGEGRPVVLPLVEHAVAGSVLLDREAGGWAAAQVLEALVFVDAYDQALDVAARVEAAGRRCGSILGGATGRIYRTAVHIQRGELLQTEAELRALIQIATDAEMPMWLITGVYLVADALIERPQLADVMALADGVQIDPAFAATATGAMLQVTRGRFALARGNHRRAAEELRQAAGIYRALGYGPASSPWRSELALALAHDEPGEARGLLEEELALARASGLGRPVGISLRAAGILAGGEAGIGLLREALTTLEPTEARLEVARTQLALGSALRRAQRRGEAREHLQMALGMGRQFGADRLAARAADELRVAGVHPRHRHGSGVDALTASEARVARLAASGRTNLEIAHELYVGLKTVETHLSSAYAKLGLAGQGSRKRLAVVLAQEAG